MKTQSMNPLDLSVNAVLDITPRKVGLLAFRACKGLFRAVSRTEVKELRKEIEELKQVIVA